MKLVFATLLFTWSSWDLLSKFEIFLKLSFNLQDNSPFPVLFLCPNRSLPYTTAVLQSLPKSILTSHSLSSLYILCPLYPLPVLSTHLLFSLPHSVSFLPATLCPLYTLHVLPTNSVSSLPTSCTPCPAHSLSFLPTHCSS